MQIRAFHCQEMGSYLTKIHEVNSISASLEWYIKQSGKKSTPAVENLVNPTVMHNML